jgi:hypothetical protein
MTAMSPQPPCILTLDEVVTLPGAPADHRISYGPDPAQFGDLYLPPQPGPHPVVLLLHGGCWQAQYSLTLVGQPGAALRQAGLAVWNMAYRRLGNGGGWPQPRRRNVGVFSDLTLYVDALALAGQHDGITMSLLHEELKPRPHALRLVRRHPST